MPNIITAKRLAEIKARLDARNAEIHSQNFRRAATLEFVSCAAEDIPDLIATLERAVKLLRCHKDPHFNDDIGEFLGEFDQ